MMRKKMSVGLLILVLAGVCFWNLQRPEADTVQVGPLQIMSEQDDNISVKATEKRIQLSSKVKKEGGEKEYQFLQDCLTYARFSVILNRQAKDPQSLLNNPEKINELPVRQRLTFRERIDLVRRMKLQCESWNATISPKEAAVLMYDAALESGRRGDLRASACFVMAPWSTPPENSPEAKAFENLYHLNARQLANDAIKAGSWPAALAAYNSTREQHGVRTLIGYSQEEQYQLARLLQMGTADPDLATSLSYESARLGAGLNAGVIVRSDEWARKMFNGAFGGKAMTDDDIRENCGN